MAQNKIVYVLSCNPKTETEKVSEVLAQALTALSFDYACELFFMGEAVTLAKKSSLAGLKVETFESVETMLDNFREMEGQMFVCHPAADARGLKEADCIEGVHFVNASKLVESAVNAKALFTF